MLETSGRLLRLLSLFQSQRYWAGKDLADRLEVTPRTLRRDVDRLRSLGYPVDSSPGTAGGYQLGSGAHLPPLHLDDEEAVAVAVGLRTAASGTVTGMEESSLRALAKLEQVLPERLRRRVRALHTFIVPLAHGGPTVNAEALSAIAAACRDCQRLKFRYESRDGTPSLREVEPHRLVHTGRRWYLAAWDTGRGNWRTFRVDRIKPKPSTGARFAPRQPPEGDFAAFVLRSVSYAPYLYRAKVLFRVPIQVAAERIPAVAGTLEAIDEHTCLLHTGASSLDMLAVHLVLTGFEFAIVEPPELIDCMRALAEKFASAARGVG